MATALGLHSPKLDAVRELLTKRGRRDQGRFAFEGSTLLVEAIASGFDVEAVYATEAAYAELDPRLSGGLPCPVYLVAERAIRRISALESPPGLVAVAPARLEPGERLLEGGRPALLLAGVADPGNAGTLLRSAEIFGVPGVLFAADGVEPYNPKVVRASMGAIFRQRLAVVEAADVLAAARAKQYAVIAADRSGKPLGTFTFPERVIVAVGSERGGARRWLPHWDATVAIPQDGRGDSLNAAVAGSIVLYELARHRSELSSTLSTRQKP